jgi:hypothetical protein
VNKNRTISFILCTYLFIHPRSWNFIVGLCVQRNRFAGWPGSYRGLGIFIAFNTERDGYLVSVTSIFVLLHFLNQESVNVLYQHSTCMMFCSTVEQV